MSTSVLLFFFFNDTATTEIYTLSLHDALPIYHIAVPVHRDILLGLVDLETLEAIDAELFQQLEGVRARHVHVGHVVGLVEQHGGLLPRALLVPPVGVFGLLHRIRVRTPLRITQVIARPALGA